MNLKFFSAAKQDEFVANILNFKKSGYCVDIGSEHSSFYNNTYFFQAFDWNSITIELQSFYNQTYQTRKNNLHINEDALTLDYNKIFEQHKFPKSIDYLSLDVDTSSLDVLKILPLNEYRFKVITIEHDAYLYGDEYRIPQREILSSYGYTLLCSNVHVEQPEFEGRVCPFEDWWVDEKEFDKDLLDRIRCDNKYPSQIINEFKNTKAIPMNVTLYAISKNEENNIEKFLENSKKFSHTVVVDTGSRDNTVQLLRDAGIEVYEHPQSKDEFDFSVARNQALSHVKTDWAFSLDFNEDVGEFFSEGLEVIEGEFTKFNHLRFDDNGQGEPQQSFEVHTRFHRTNNYQWANAVHEIPIFVPAEDYPEESVVDTTIKITKKINKSISKELFYLEICEREYKKDPTNWYYIWFIFNHYFNVGNYSRALEYGQEFLNITKPYFDSFRITAFIKSSICLFQLKEIQRGANYAFHAVSEAMNMGEPLLSQAFTHLNQVAQVLNNPNITIFSTAFNADTLKSNERKKAIFELSNVDRYYAEHKTDRYIRENFFPDKSYKGVFVEVGAGGPTFLSNSKHFKESGWRIICVEPNPKFVEQHKKEGNEVYQYACCAEDGESTFFVNNINDNSYTEENSGAGYSALEIRYKDIPGHYTQDEIKVKTIKLNTLLEKIDVEQIDVLSIDTEGWELEVMEGFDADKYNPKVIILENYEDNPNYEIYMKTIGYVKVHNLKYNEFYIKK